MMKFVISTDKLNINYDASHEKTGELSIRATFPVPLHQPIYFNLYFQLWDPIIVSFFFVITSHPLILLFIFYFLF